MGSGHLYTRTGKPPCTLAPCEGMEKGQGKTCVLSRHISLHLDLRRPRFQICENECLLFDRPSPCMMFQEFFPFFSLLKLNLPIFTTHSVLIISRPLLNSHHPVPHPTPPLFQRPSGFFPPESRVSHDLSSSVILPDLSFTPSLMVSFNISYTPHMGETISLPFCD